MILTLNESNYQETDEVFTINFCFWRMKAMNRYYSNLKNSELYSLAEIYNIMKRGEYRAAYKKLFLLAKLAEPNPENRGMTAIRSLNPQASPNVTQSATHGMISMTINKDHSEINKFFLRQAIKHCYHDLLFLQVEKCLLEGDKYFLNDVNCLKAMEEYKKIDNFLQLLKIEIFLQQVKDDISKASNEFNENLMEFDTLVMYLSVLHHYYHNKALLLISLSKDYGSSINCFKKAMEIKNLFFLYCQKHRSFIQRIFPQWLFSAPTSGEGTIEEGSGSMLQYWYYFFQNYTISEANLLICLLHTERYSDGLALLKGAKHRQTSFDTIVKDLPAMHQNALRKEEMHRVLLEKMCYAYCLIKSNRLLEAEVLLQKPLYASISSVQLESFWKLLQQEITKERIQFKDEINRHKVNRHILSHYKQSLQSLEAQQQAKLSPLSVIIDKSPPLSSDYKTNTSPILPWHENIYKTIHFTPNSKKSPDTSQSPTFEKKKFDNWPELKVKETPLPENSVNLGLAASDTLTLRERLMQEEKTRRTEYNDTLSISSSGHGNRRPPHHVRKSAFLQSSDFQGMKNMVTTKDNDEPLTKEKPRIKADDYYASTTSVPLQHHLGRPMNGSSNDQHYLSDTQSQLHSRRESRNSFPLQSPEKVALEKDKLNSGNAHKFSKPRYKSTSFDLFELRKVDDDQFKGILSPLKEAAERIKERDLPPTMKLEPTKEEVIREKRELTTSTPALVAVEESNSSLISLPAVSPLEEMMFSSFQQSDKPQRPSFPNRVPAISMSSSSSSSSATSPSAISKAVTEPMLVHTANIQSWSLHAIEITTPSSIPMAEFRSLSHEDMHDLVKIEKPVPTSTGEEKEGSMKVKNPSNTPQDDVKSEPLSPSSIILKHAYSYSESQIIASSSDLNRLQQHHQYTAVHYRSSAELESVGAGYMREISEKIPDVSNLQITDTSKILPVKADKELSLTALLESDSSVEFNTVQKLPPANPLSNSHVDLGSSSAPTNLKQILNNSSPQNASHSFNSVNVAQTKIAAKHDLVSQEKEEGRKSIAKHLGNSHYSRVKIFHPYDRLKSPGPYPSDVDVKYREQHLDNQQFYYVFQMSKDEFYNLPLWKQKLKKKSALLF